MSLTPSFPTCCISTNLQNLAEEAIFTLLSVLIGQERKHPRLLSHATCRFAKVGFPLSEEEDEEDEDVLQLGAATMDSGCRTPESFGEALADINRINLENSDIDSSGQPRSTERSLTTANSTLYWKWCIT